MRKAIMINRQLSRLTGAVRITFEQARSLSQKGWEVRLCGDEVNFKWCKEHNVRTSRIWKWPWGGYARRRHFAQAVDRLLNKQPHDLVIGHGDNMHQDILFLHNLVHLSHECIHGSPLPNDSDIGRLHSEILTNGTYKTLVLNSQLMKEDLMDRFLVPTEKIKLLRPGFDPQQFNKNLRQDPNATAKIKKEHDLPLDRLIVSLITSGDLKTRNVSCLIEAFAGLPIDLQSKAHLFIVARDKRKKQHEQYCTDLGIGQKVSFAEPINEVERLYSVTDILINPSFIETFSLAVLEAMACQTPTVVSTNVGALEILPSVSKDFVFAPSEAEKLTHLLQKLIQSEQQRQEIANRNYEASHNFTWEKHCQAFEKIIEELHEPPQERLQRPRI